MLVLVTFFWGVSYLLIDLSLGELGRFLSILCVFSLPLLPPCCSFPSVLRAPSRATLKLSLCTGMALLCVYSFNTFGVKYTSLTNAGFLCALTVVFTPLLDYLFFRTKPSRKLFLVLIMSVTGIALLTLSNTLRPALGDILCILCAVSNATYLLVTERGVTGQEINAFQLGIYQQLFAGLGMLILSLILKLPLSHIAPRSGAAY